MYYELNLSKAVSIRIYNLLSKHKMSKYRLEKESGIAHSTMGFIFSGKNKDIKLSTVAKVCSVFKITLNEFFNDKVFELTDMDLNIK